MTEKMTLTFKQTTRLACARFAGEIVDSEVDSVADEAQAFRTVVNDTPIKRDVFGPGPFKIEVSKNAAKIIRKLLVNS